MSLISFIHVLLCPKNKTVVFFRLCSTFLAKGIDWYFNAFCGHCECNTFSTSVSIVIADIEKKAALCFYLDSKHFTELL